MKRKLFFILTIFISSSILISCTKKTEVNPSEAKTKSVSTVVTSSGNTKESAQSTLTEKDAIGKIEKIIGSLAEGYKLEFDRMDTREGKEYFVIHFFETVIDNPETGESHQTTVTWYYVNKKTGEVYEWDLIEDKLKEVSAIGK